MKNNKLIIILILMYVFIPFAFSSAKTVKIDGMTFVVGKHEPQKRLTEVEKEYKNPKALEVRKQPEHGRELRLEETEEYIESHDNVPNFPQNINNNILSNNIGVVKKSSYPLEMNSGAHVTVGGVWTNTSSRTLKENIFNIDNQIGLDTVLDLQPVIYNYKIQPGETYAGFIAEDVPELVATSDRKSLSPMDIVAVVVGAIQNIWNKIVLIEENITNIFNRLKVIENKLNINNNSGSQNNNSNNNNNSDTESNDQENQNEDSTNNDNQEDTENDTTQDDNQDSENTQNNEEENSNEDNIVQEDSSQDNQDSTDNQNTDNQDSSNETENSSGIENQDTQTDNNNEQDNSSENDEQNNQDQNIDEDASQSESHSQDDNNDVNSNE